MGCILHSVKFELETRYLVGKNLELIRFSSTAVHERFEVSNNSFLILFLCKLFMHPHCIVWKFGQPMS